MRPSNLKTFAIVLIALTASAFTADILADYSIQPEFTIAFDSKDPKGTFGELSGDITFDPADLDNSYFNVIVPVTSIDTGNKLKSKHARGKDWFEADKYPNITFKSSKITQSDKGFNVTGNLTIKDVTKEISFPFTFEKNTFKGSFVVNRVAYNIGKAGGPVEEEITVNLEVPVTGK